jgi:ATP-dependent RNA helicase RhlE
MPRRSAQKAICFVTTPTFDALGLAEPFLRALNDAEYTQPTPIQAKSIPALLEGRDLLGLAETGTGKTAAFVLPMLQRLAAEGGRPQPGAPRALILAPTRELAIQIGESIKTYGRHVRISHTVIFGGVGQRPQVSAIARGVDILVATPGRLLDLIDQRHLRLNQIRTFVLDEADRMLDMGFVRDVRRILKLVPAERHALLFSATMPRDIADLAAEILKNPLRVEIARAGKTVDRIDQRVMFLSAGAKREALASLLQDPEMRRVIVFTRTKRGADRVCQAVEHIGVGVHAIHGNKSQGQRQSALDSFRKGFTRVLVATDIAARGIDIDDITHVINYELPNIPESYVHRIGRTARAGAEGVAIALCAPDEREYLRDIERLTGRALTVIGAPAFSGVTPAVEESVRPATNGHAPRKGSRPQRDGGPRRDRPENARGRSDRPRREERHGAPRRDRPEYRQNNGHGDAMRTEGAPSREHDGAPRSDRRNGEAHAPRNGEHRQGGRPHSGRPQGDRPQGERPQGGRPHGERPHRGREDDQRSARRNGDGRPPQNGERQHHAGGRGPRAEHRNGDAPRKGDANRSNGAPHSGEPGKDAPQPWRNWTRGSGVSHGEARREGGQGRPTRKRPEDRRRDGGHNRGRDAR